MDYRLGYKPSTLNEAGEFEGYAVVYNTVDGHGTKFAPGSFDDVVLRCSSEGKYPAVFLDHYLQGGEPCGQQILIPDDKGLLVRGKLWLDTNEGKKAYQLIKNTKYGMSFWATAAPGEYHYDTDGCRVYDQIAELHETTLTATPSNPKARVMLVRSDGTTETIEKTAEEIAADNAKVAEAVTKAKAEGKADGIAEATATIKEEISRQVRREIEQKREQERAQHVSAFLNNWLTELKEQ